MNIIADLQRFYKMEYGKSKAVIQMKKAEETCSSNAFGLIRQPLYAMMDSRKLFYRGQGPAVWKDYAPGAFMRQDYVVIHIRFASADDCFASLYAFAQGFVREATAARETNDISGKNIRPAQREGISPFEFTGESSCRGWTIRILTKALNMQERGRL